MSCYGQSLPGLHAAHPALAANRRRPWTPPMPHADFVHLCAHSAYSLSDGAIKADKLPALAREAGMPAVAITDTSNLFGALEFSQGCTAKGC